MAWAAAIAVRVSAPSCFNDRVRLVALVACLAACGRLGFGPERDGATGEGAAGDVAGNGDGIVPGICSTTVALADDFEDGTPAAEWSVLAGTNLTLAETNGFLQITFGSNVPASQSAGYVTANPMDFTGACVEVEVAMIPNPATIAQATIRIGTPTDCGDISIYGGAINASQHRGASITRFPAFAFDPVAHRFLRMRESAGSWAYEASPNGTDWTQFGSVANTFPNAT